MKNLVLLIIVVATICSCHEEPKPKPKNVNMDSIAFEAGRVYGALKHAFNKGKQAVQDSIAKDTLSTNK